jgi:N-acetylmuramoyl-L-alanine amidase
MAEDEELKLSALHGIVLSGQKLHIDVSDYANELDQMNSSSSSAKELQNDIYTPEPVTNKNDIQVTSTHKLKSIRWKNERLVLEFDKTLRSNQVNYFTLNDTEKSQYRYIFDIHASMLTKSQNLRKEGIDRIKIAQFNSNTLRLVIEDSSDVTVRFKVEKKELVIYMEPKVEKKVAAQQQSVLKKETSSKEKVIVIDAGHGGKDPGAVGYRKYREKVIVLQVAQRLKSYLKARGYQVYMTRDKDAFIKLSKRTEYANQKNADLFISIHANAVDSTQASGVECYFLSTSRSERAKKVAAKENSADLSDMNYYGKESFLNTLSSHNIVASNKLAIDLQRGMLATLSSKYKDVKDGGVREGPFWVLVGAQMPSVLVEVGFVSNPKEAKRLVDKTYQELLAKGLADGVERYFLNN